MIRGFGGVSSALNISINHGCYWVINRANMKMFAAFLLDFMKRKGTCLEMTRKDPQEASQEDRFHQQKWELNAIWLSTVLRMSILHQQQ